MMAETETVPAVGLALQGGGAHAAFTWGVLDRLLIEVEQGKLVIRAISGTSGGALNGAACAYGLNESVSEARHALERLWTLVGASSYWHPFYNFPNDFLTSPLRWNVDHNPLVMGQGIVQPFSSPYATPWLNNPIGPIMEQVIPDFSIITQHKLGTPDLYVAATNVNLTALRIFGPKEITAKVLTASTCLPTIFEAVNIEGEFYWDGGYMANPALNPLVDSVDDILSVLIDPLFIEQEPPRSPWQIVNRMNELSFGASWVSEIRQIELINELSHGNTLVHHGKKYECKRFHVIRADGFMSEIGAASKSTPSIEFFRALRDAGRHAADSWVHECLQYVGKKSTFDLEKLVKNRLNGTSSAIETVRQFGAS
jgi:NTE family protein